MLARRCAFVQQQQHALLIDIRIWQSFCIGERVLQTDAKHVKARMFANYSPATRASYLLQSSCLPGKALA
jgi:hypothetical protein